MMLDCVVSPVVDALCRAGIPAVRAFPQKPLGSGNETLVCVSVSQARGLPAGFGSYLGVETDPDTGISREVYGARAELELALDIYVAPDAPDASAQALQTAGSVPDALRFLPEGLKVSSLSLGPLSHDPKTGRFTCRALLCASASFVADLSDDGDGGVFTDFILKGSVVL